VVIDEVALRGIRADRCRGCRRNIGLQRADADGNVTAPGRVGSCKVLTPIAVSKTPVVLAANAPWPKAAFEFPVVFCCPASAPTNVFHSPLLPPLAVFALPALLPIKTL